MKKQDETEVLQAWQEAVQAEVKTRPWLASLFLQKGNQLFTRFVTFYARLTAVKQQTRRRLAVGVGTAALMLALSSAPTPAHAATITVGPGCTLVQAIQSANTDTSVGGVCTTGSGPDTIVLGGNTYSYTTANGTDSALPNITSEITIEANGATIQRNSGAPNMRIITVTSTGNLTLNNATITGGNGVTRGGGIYNLGGTTTLNNSTVSGNAATSTGGGIHSRGGTGRLTLNNSTVSGNTANGFGGGIYTASAGNTATLNNSTVSGNTTSNSFGGGGGIARNFGTLTLNNSTVSGGNTNSGSLGGGGIYGRGTLTLARTIISGNSGSPGAEINHTFGTVTADAHNLFGHNLLTNAQAFSGFTPGASDITATSDGTNNTALASILYTTLDGGGVPIPTLADNGGPTLTHALVTGSPAIDLDPSASCSGAPIYGLDQRGVARSQDGNASGTAACDAGAVEMGQLQCGIQAAIEPFPLTFAQASNVLVNVTNDGADLDCVRVTEIGHDHPNATSSVSNMALETGRYWQIAGLQNSTSATPATTDFTVNLRLPFAGADVNGDNRACKWLGGGLGFGWDCGDDADNEEVTGVSVTRLNYTGGFSDWAVGDNVGPTAVANLYTQTNTPNQNAYIPLLATLLTLLSGAWLWLRRPTR